MRRATERSIVAIIASRSAPWTCVSTRDSFFEMVDRRSEIAPSNVCAPDRLQQPRACLGLICQLALYALRCLVKQRWSAYIISGVLKWISDAEDVQRNIRDLLRSLPLPLCKIALCGDPLRL